MTKAETQGAGLLTSLGRSSRDDAPGRIEKSARGSRVAAAKGNERFNNSNGNKLLQKLLVAVLSYMEDEITSNGGAVE